MVAMVTVVASEIVQMRVAVLPAVTVVSELVSMISWEVVAEIIFVVTVVGMLVLTLACWC